MDFFTIFSYEIFRALCSRKSKSHFWPLVVMIRDNLNTWAPFHFMVDYDIDLPPLRWVILQKLHQHPSISHGERYFCRCRSYDNKKMSFIFRTHDNGS